jgi:hypothetical protein
MFAAQRCETATVTPQFDANQVMSRRSLKKPDSETGLIEATYRCPKCGAATNRWIKD